jgi:hypothetical protein
MTDIQISDHGSIVLFTPMTDNARKWIRRHIPEDAQYFGPSLAVERRYAGDIADGMAEAGLALEDVIGDSQR